MAQLGRALTQQPALASLSVGGNLRPKLEWLRGLQIPRLTLTLTLAQPLTLTLTLPLTLKAGRAAGRLPGRALTLPRA